MVMIGWKVRTSGNTYYRKDNRIRNIFNLRIIIRSYILRYVIIEREIKRGTKETKKHFCISIFTHIYSKWLKSKLQYFYTSRVKVICSILNRKNNMLSYYNKALLTSSQALMRHRKLILHKHK